MSVFLKLFNTTAEYNAYTADTSNFILPNVSYCQDVMGINYTPVISIANAVITCDSATYNGQTQVATNIVVALNGSTLVSGTDYTVSNNDGGINAGNYSFTIDGIGNYSGSKNGIFTINKVTPTVVIPTANVLTYNGSAQELVTAGSANWGTLKYSLDGTNYSTSIPTATNYGSYTVYYKVDGDSNVNDVAPATVQCSINEKQVTATVELSQSTYTYDGTAKEPTVTVKDGSTVIDPSEYSVAYSNNVNAGTGTCTISDNVGGNYEVIGSATFTINKANPIYTAPTTNSGLVYNGSVQALLNAGSTNDGTIQYSIDESTWGTTIPSQTNANTYTSYWRLVGDSNHNDVASTSISTVIDKVTPTVTAPTAKVLTYNGSAQELVNAGSTDWGTLQYRAGSDSWSTSIPTRTRGGSYTVEYKVVGDSNINNVSAQSVNCSINEKPVTATVTLSQTAYTYNGSACQPTPTVSDGGTVIPSSEYTVTYSNNINAGTGTVTISDNVGGDYNVIGSATFTINKANPTYTAPTATSPTYNGSAQNLLNAGSTSDGTIQYSSNNSSWSTTMPTGTNANTYTSYWRLVGDSNHNDVASTSISTTIAKANQSAPTATGATTTYSTTATATASGGGGQGSLEWESAQSQTSVGSHSTRARWSGNSNYNASPWSNSVTVQMNKANQSAPTATGATVDYGSTATATASGGGGQGTLTWTNGSTRTAVGSQTTQAYWSGNGNYNASPYSNSVTLTVNDPYAGHDYVEIGGLKWATMNIGANSTTGTGLYFQWGDTQGYTASQVGSGSGQKYFGWADYKYGNGTSNPWDEDMTKYNETDGKTVLDISDDAARANWGGQWRMPTAAEYGALGNAVNTAWTADYQGSGVAGVICTDKTNSSKVLFFPAAGRCFDGKVDAVGILGYNRSSSLDGNHPRMAYFLLFFEQGVNWQNGNFGRYYGFPVRGVVG